MARYLAAIQGSRGEASRLGTGASGIRAQAQGWDLGVKVYGHPSQDPANPDRDVFSVYVTGGSNASHSDIHAGSVYLESDGSVSFEPSDFLVSQVRAFRSTDLYVRDEESGDAAILGKYLRTIEDVVRYQRPDGSIGSAPADCVSIVSVV